MVLLRIVETKYTLGLLVTQEIVKNSIEFIKLRELIYEIISD